MKKKLTVKEAFTLAVRNHKNNNLAIAEKLYIEVMKINPNHIGAIFLLGSLSAQKKEFKEAIIYYKKAILIDSNHTLTINNLTVLLRDTELNYLTKIGRSNIKELLLFLFRRNDIDHKDIFLIARFLLFKEKQHDYNQIKNLISSGSSLLKNQLIRNLLKEELFLLMLQKSLMADHFLEQILTKLRKEILFAFNNSDENILRENFNFIISLAEQCFLNEYVYSQDKKEIDYINQLKNSLENKKEVNELKIAILSCYLPLCSSENIMNKLLKYESKNILFSDLINMQIREPLEEKKLLTSFESLGHISDDVSKKVREQYEKHPYPRWRYTYKSVPANFLTIINGLIKPNKIESNNTFDNPNVLIAGCGTGRQIFLAEGYLNANILGVDLSLLSLAYAKRKTKEFGFKNIKFLHADILQLQNLEEKFDVIECVGVLHHMKDPLQGLRILLNLLEPYGVMRLGLYSQLARQDVTKIREFIEKNKFKNSINDIRNCREIISKNKEDRLLQKLLYRRDFYSTSSIRDLMFHVQEHHFTLTQLSMILKNLNLEFLGFTDLQNKKKFSQLFPNDKNNISLDNWNEFETNNEDTFFGMYNFLVRKKID